MRSWARTYWRMVVWDLADLRLLLPVLAAILMLQGAGFVLGIGLFFSHIPETAALFVATGVPVLNLITAGLVFEPQVVADQRLRGSYDFLWSFPVPRSAMTAAWYTVTLATALPAVVAALATAVARYHVHFDVTPAIVPAVLLTSLTGVATYHLHLDITAAIVPAVLAVSLTGVLMGYALAHAITVPMIARLVSASLIFVSFGFSPIMFPAGQLPDWLAQVNRWLPFGSMATIMRSALVTGMAAGVVRAYLVVAAWAVGSGLIAAWAVGRRG